MTAEEAADVSDRINLNALRAYWAAVGDRTQAIVEKQRPQDLNEENTPDHILQVVEKDGMFQEAGMWGEGYWAELPERSRGYFLAYVGHTHNWVHYGERMATRKKSA